jgi:hypothetical protein
MLMRRKFLTVLQWSCRVPDRDKLRFPGHLGPIPNWCFLNIRPCRGSCEVPRQGYGNLTRSNKAVFLVVRVCTQTTYGTDATCSISNTSQPRHRRITWNRVQYDCLSCEAMWS